MNANCNGNAGLNAAYRMRFHLLTGSDASPCPSARSTAWVGSNSAGRAEGRVGAAWPIKFGMLLLLIFLAHPLMAQAEDQTSVDACDAPNRRIAQLEALYQAAEQEQARLRLENADLKERLQQSAAFAALSQQIDEQSSLLARLATMLNLDAEATDDPAGQGLDTVSMVDENARLRAELDAANRRMQLLTEQFGEAHRLRLDALAEAAAARANNAELDARLRQRGQAADEALMRADKAEKLYAALEEAHLRISTENERLTRDLATARERQAEALRRVVELDSLLASAEARGLPIADTGGATVETLENGASTTVQVTSDVTEAGSGSESNSDSNSDGNSGRVLPVIYRVRADDTLSSISAKVYGNPNDWGRIFEANRDLLRTPDDLALGMSLVIP